MNSGITIGWVALKGSLACMACMVSVEMDAKNMGTSSITTFMHHCMWQRSWWVLAFISIEWFINKIKIWFTSGLSRKTATLTMPVHFDHTLGLWPKTFATSLCFYWTLSLLFHDILLLRLGAVPEPSLMAAISTCSLLLDSRLDTWFIQSSNLHLLFFQCTISDWLELLLTLYLSQ